MVYDINEIEQENPEPIFERDSPDCSENELPKINEFEEDLFCACGSGAPNGCCNGMMCNPEANL